MKINRNSLATALVLGTLWGSVTLVTASPTRTSTTIHRGQNHSSTTGITTVHTTETEHFATATTGHETTQ